MDTREIWEGHDTGHITLLYISRKYGPINVSPICLNCVETGILLKKMSVTQGIAIWGVGVSDQIATRFLELTTPALILLVFRLRDALVRRKKGT